MATWKRALALAAMVAFSAPLAQAQTDYPSRPVRIIVGFGAGAVADTPARLLAQKLSQSLGQQFVVENRPGAGSNIAAESVARAVADGHTLFMATSANTINATTSNPAFAEVMPARVCTGAGARRLRRHYTVLTRH
jgi:tripartite-type tricarboxylate transporter receptor subunit TctC